jgi:hypothetical protein
VSIRAYSTIPSGSIIKKYENMDTQKLKILEENKGKSGVYLIRNLNNKKFYVGSSIDIGRRFKEYFNISHLLRRDKLPICAALSKYGYSQFSVEIMEYCNISIVIEREQYYLNLLKPQYNILKIAGSLKGFLHSEETKNKLSDVFKGNVNSLNQPNATPVTVLDLETGKTNKYTSARKAAEALNISNSIVSGRLREKSHKPYLKRYVFRNYSSSRTITHTPCANRLKITRNTVRSCLDSEKILNNK